MSANLSSPMTQRILMVALGDEGWFAPGYGDGSHAYSGLLGVGFIGNLAIHYYLPSTTAPSTCTRTNWKYPYSWGNQWIQQHDAVGKSSGKPVVLEEYGSPFPGKHTETEGPWQQTVLQNSHIAYDAFWQFGPPLHDDLSIDADTADFDTLVTKHATAMLKKTPIAN